MIHDYWLDWIDVKKSLLISVKGNILPSANVACFLQQIIAHCERPEWLCELDTDMEIFHDLIRNEYENTFPSESLARFEYFF